MALTHEEYVEIGKQCDKRYWKDSRGWNQMFDRLVKKRLEAMRRAAVGPKLRKKPRQLSQGEAPFATARPVARVARLW